MIFFGKTLGIRALISYEGVNAHDLIDDFHGAVDDYLKTWRSEGIQPEMAYEGSFNIHISSELHKKAAIIAMSKQMSLNIFVELSIAHAANSEA